MKYSYDIFISYAPADQRIASRICHLLEAKGYPCYLESRDGAFADYGAGQNRSFRERVFGIDHPAATGAGASSRAIRSSRLFLLLLSRASRRNASVRTELFLANDQASKGMHFLGLVIDDELDLSSLEGDFQYVLRDAPCIRWNGRRGAHQLVTVIRQQIAPAGIPGITVELSEADEELQEELGEPEKISDFLHFLDEQADESLDYLTAEAKKQYDHARESMREDKAEAIAAFERVAELLDGEWKADNIESRRMLTDSYIQLARLKENEAFARKALDRAEKLAREVDSEPDLCNYGVASTVLAGIIRKGIQRQEKQNPKTRKSPRPQWDVNRLYSQTVEIYERLVQKEPSKANRMRLMYALWAVVSWNTELSEEEREQIYQKIQKTTDALYAEVCDKDKSNYKALEQSYRKMEKFYRTRNGRAADKCQVRAQILRQPQ